MNKYFLKKPDNLADVEADNSDNVVSENNQNNVNEEVGDISEHSNDVCGKFGDSSDGNEKSDNTILEPYVDIYDPRVWDGLDEKYRDLLIEKGPIRESNLEYPVDKLGRRFSSNFYIRMLQNGEKHDRKWLVYSKELDKVFCFCCKLFKTMPSRSLLGSEGICDWKHLSEKLAQHENSKEHLINLKTCVELQFD